MEADENINLFGEGKCPHSEECGYADNCDGDYEHCGHSSDLEKLSKIFGESPLDGNGPKLNFDMNDEYDRMAASREIESEEA